MRDFAHRTGGLAGAAGKTLRRETAVPLRESCVERFLTLQRTAGNRAIERLFRRPTPSARPAARGGTSRVMRAGSMVLRQDLEFELEVPTPEERRRLRERGVQLPRVSSRSADPRHHRDYVDRRLTAVGFGIYLGGYMLYLNGVDMPVFVPESHFDFTTTNASPADLAIFPDYAAASAAVPYGPYTRNQPTPYTYYWGAGGAVIAPTLFTRATTPRVITTALKARRQLAQYVQAQLGAVAIGIAGGLIIRAVAGAIRWLVRARGSRGPALRSPLSRPAARARRLARQVRDSGDEVVANMGGAGSRHEPANAININNQAVPRRGIRNHVQADASDIGQLFDPGTVDRVVGYRMPPRVIDWQRAVRGIRSVLRPGGTFRFSYQGGNAEARTLARLLREAGFDNVVNMSDTLITATRR